MGLDIRRDRLRKKLASCVDAEFHMSSPYSSQKYAKSVKNSSVTHLHRPAESHGS